MSPTGGQILLVMSCALGSALWAMYSIYGPDVVISAVVGGVVAMAVTVRR